MTSRQALLTLLFSAVVCQVANADNWQEIEGAENLRKFVAGATAEITLQPGVIAIGKYNPDGSAEISAWGETFLRSWMTRDGVGSCRVASGGWGVRGVW